MTNQEAIASLKTLCHTCELFPKCVNDKPECYQAIEMAISALEAQEICDLPVSPLLDKAKKKRKQELANNSQKLDNENGEYLATNLQLTCNNDGGKVSRKLFDQIKTDGDLISRKALCDYALNQKDKSITPNDIMRFPSALSQEKSKISQWIPVSERLPEEDGLYLVTTSIGQVQMHVFNHNGNSEEYWTRCNKAWVPLPEPYQEESV